MADALEAARRAARRRKKVRRSKSQRKNKKKGFGDTLRGLFPYGCAGSFCIGGFENFLLGIFFVKLINNIYY